MKHIVAALGVALGLASCAAAPVQPSLIINKPVLVKIPPSLLVCNVAKLPGSFSSNKDVAGLLASTYNNNVQCKNNMDGIKSYQNSAGNRIK